MRNIDEIDRRLTARQKAIEDRIASRISGSNAKKADAFAVKGMQPQYEARRIEFPDGDKMPCPAPPPYGKGLSFRRMMCAPYSHSRGRSATAGFIGSLVYIVGVVAICLSLRNGDNCGMTSIWDVLLNMGLCGIFQSVVYFKTISENFLEALSSMNAQSWLCFVFWVFIVLLISGVFGPVMFALNCSNFALDVTVRQGGKASLAGWLLVVAIVCGSIFGTLATGCWINERMEVISEQRLQLR